MLKKIILILIIILFSACFYKEKEEDIYIEKLKIIKNDFIENKYNIYKRVGMNEIVKNGIYIEEDRENGLIHYYSYEKIMILSQNETKELLNLLGIYGPKGKVLIVFSDRYKKIFDYINFQDNITSGDFVYYDENDTMINYDNKKNEKIIRIGESSKFYIKNITNIGINGFEGEILSQSEIFNNNFYEIKLLGKTDMKIYSMQGEVKKGGILRVNGELEIEKEYIIYGENFYYGDKILKIDEKILTFSDNIFYESEENNGKIKNYIDVFISNAKFKTDNNFINGIDYNIYNLPLGLEINIEKKSENNIRINLIGNALNHSQIDSIEDFALEFLTNAFLNENSQNIKNSIKTDFKINYYNDFVQNSTDIIIKEEYQKKIMLSNDKMIIEKGLTINMLLEAVESKNGIEQIYSITSENMSGESVLKTGDKFIIYSKDGTNIKIYNIEAKFKTNYNRLYLKSSIYNWKSILDMKLTGDYRWEISFEILPGVYEFKIDDSYEWENFSYGYTYINYEWGNSTKNIIFTNIDSNIKIIYYEDTKEFQIEGNHLKGNIPSEKDAPSTLYIMGSMNAWLGNYMEEIQKYKWKITRYISKGEHYFKFSEKDDWNTEKIYGYSGINGLANGFDNIPYYFENEGVYIITFDYMTAQYTIKFASYNCNIKKRNIADNPIGYIEENNVEIEKDSIVSDLINSIYSEDGSNQVYKIYRENTLLEGGNVLFNNDILYVYAEDEVSLKKYIIKTIVKDENADLESLTVYNESFEPTFSKDTIEYISYVDNIIENITLSAISQSTRTAISINGIQKENYNYTEKFNLEIGKNEFEIKVKAENGNEKLYYLTIIRLENYNKIEKKLFLKGSFNNWKIPLNMLLTANNIWSIDLNVMPNEWIQIKIDDTYEWQSVSYGYTYCNYKWGNLSKNIIFRSETEKVNIIYNDSKQKIEIYNSFGEVEMGNIPSELEEPKTLYLMKKTGEIWESYEMTRNETEWYIDLDIDTEDIVFKFSEFNDWSGKIYGIDETEGIANGDADILYLIREVGNYRITFNYFNAEFKLELGVKINLN